MLNDPLQVEAAQFAERLRQSLQGAGVRPSPTIVANEFNLRYWGKSITPHTARNWLLGKSIPMQDKLRVLADWLHVSADELRFGMPRCKVSKDTAALPLSQSMQDRDMLEKYATLSLHDKQVVSDVVLALALAATVRNPPCCITPPTAPKPSPTASR